MSTTVSIDIELVTQAFNKALKDATKNTDTFAEKAKSGFQSVQSSFTVMAGTLAANAVTSIVKGITGSFGAMIDEASKAETATNNLNTSLRQAGLYSAATSKDLHDFADSLELASVFEGEVIMASAGLLASLTNLDAKGIKQATQSAADLAATLNIDLQSATDMIAKAVNGNTSQFTRMGIEIQKGSTDAERLSNTLAALSGQAGAAEAQTRTYAGAMAQLDNAQGKVLEHVGKLLTQNPLLISSITAAAQALNSSAEWISNNADLLTDLSKTIAITTAVVGTLTVAFYAVKFALDAQAIAAAVAWAATLGPIALVTAGVAAVGVAVFALVRYWDDVKAAVYNAIAATLEYTAKGVGLLSGKAAESLNAEAAAWRLKATATLEAAQVAKDVSKEEQEQAEQRSLKLATELEELARKNEEELALVTEHNESLLLIQQMKDLSFEEQEIAHQDIMAQTSLFYGMSNFQATLQRQMEILQAKQAYEREQLRITNESELAKAKAINDAEARNKAIKVANDKAAIENAKLRSQQELDVLKQQNKAEEQLNAMKIANQRDTIATIATMRNSNNKYLAAIGKAAALTQIAIETPVAIAKALSAFPPPANFIAAGLVGAAMAVQAAQVAGIKFADGGIVPGSSNSGDQIRASLNSGEMVLNKNQQANLFKMANSRPGMSSSDTSSLELLLERIAIATESGMVVQIDGREIANVLRDERAGGRSI